jgi:hypothetical protein
VVQLLHITYKQAYDIDSTGKLLIPPNATEAWRIEHIIITGQASDIKLEIL